MKIDKSDKNFKSIENNKLQIKRGITLPEESSFNSNLDRKDLDEIFTASLENIYVFDRNGKYTYVSPGGAHVFGLEPHDIIGKTWNELELPEETEFFVYNKDIIFNTGQNVSGEVSLKTINGRKELEYFLNPILGTNNNVKAVECTVKDVTRRKRAEQTWLETEEWLGATLRGINEALIATDQNGFLKFMNHVAEELTGWQMDDAIGKSFDNVLNLYNKGNSKKIVKILRSVIQSGEIVEMLKPVTLIKKDGTRLPITCNCTPVRNEGDEVLGTVLVFKTSLIKNDQREGI